MLYRRICYGLALLGALLFQIFYTGHLGTYILVLAMVFPVLALLLSLPAMRLCALQLQAERAVVHRGEEGAFVLSLSNRAKLPLGRLSVRICFENLLTGDLLRGRRQFYGVSQGARRREDITAHHCGTLRCRVERVWVCDLLGLFALPVRPPAPADLLVLPQVVRLEPPAGLDGGKGEGVGLRPRPGGGPGEDYDLRPYRVGDPLRTVHWKLSSKLDELVVRETLEPQNGTLVLTLDLFGDLTVLDGVLDRLYTLSLWLLERGRVHHIRWADPQSGAERGGAVEGEDDLLRRMAEILETRAPGMGKSILDTRMRVPGTDGPVRHIHVAPEEEGAP